MLFFSFRKADKNNILMHSEIDQDSIHSKSKGIAYIWQSVIFSEVKYSNDLWYVSVAVKTPDVQLMPKKMKRWHVDFPTMEKMSLTKYGKSNEQNNNV